MKKVSKVFFVTIIIFVNFFTFYFIGCSEDPNTVTNQPTYSGSFTGEWTVDKIQMVEAPNVNHPSALMKAALVPFGVVSASSVGTNTVKFGVEKWIENYIGGGSFNFIQFLNSQTGWVCDAYNSNNSSAVSIYFTNNGGNTWTAKQVTNYKKIYAMYFINENTGFLYAQNQNTVGHLLKTTNNGSNWILVNNDYSLGFYSLYFKDELVGCGNTSDKVKRTTNGGINWSTFNFGGNQTSGLQFIDNQNGMFISKLNNIYVLFKTNDGGITWTQTPCTNITGNYLREYHFINTLEGWILMGNYANFSNIYRTIDGGVSWTLVSKVEGERQNIKFTDRNNGFNLAGKDIYETNDGGTTWIKQHSTAGNNYFWNIYAFNTNKCYAIGSNGMFYSKTNEIDTAVWRINGKVTNTAIKLITNSGDYSYDAKGVYSILNNNIVFTVTNYTRNINSNIGTGTFSFGNNTVDIYLNLPNNEKWYVGLKR